MEAAPTPDIATTPFASGDTVSMRFEYQNTLDDFRETSGRKNKGFRARSPKLRVLLMLVPYVFLYAIVVLPPLRTGRWAGPNSPPGAVSSNLLLALIPPLLPVLGICGMFLYPWASISAGLGRGFLIFRRSVALLIYGALFLGIGLLLRGTRVEASPTISFWLALAIAPSPPLFYLTIWLLNFRRLENSWNRQPLQQPPRTFELTRVGVCETTAVTQARYAWSCFSGCDETRNLYILVLIDSRSFMIPKRAMTDAETETRFRAWIHELVLASKLLARDSAFAVVTANPSSASSRLDYSQQ